MVKIGVLRLLQFQSAEADVVECLIVDAERLIGILHQLMHR